MLSSNYAKILPALFCLPFRILGSQKFILSSLAKETGRDQKEERGSGQLMLMPLLISFFLKKSYFAHIKYSSFLIPRVTLAYGSIGNIKVFSTFKNGLPLFQSFLQIDVLSMPHLGFITLLLVESSLFSDQKVLTWMMGLVMKAPGWQFHFQV